MFGYGSKYGKFWEWFEAHEDEIFHFDKDQERVFDTLAAKIRRVHAELVFEFSSVNDGKREFTVSAGGIRNAFSEVTALVREAPALTRWRIIAFRQRKDVPKIKCGDRELKRESLFFDYVGVEDKIDLTVFIPGMAGASKEEIVGFKTIGYLFLDSTLGEYDVETKIAGIEFVDASVSPARRRIPLRELADVVDKLPRALQ
ncbi:MAG: hypothetical protein WB510_20510 [Candidatus Sulfotelmatobacter sp.]